MVVAPALAGSDLTQRARAALAHVEDPEIPGVSIGDLGIVRYVRERDGVAVIGIAPTYTGCPATDVIAGLARDAVRAAGIEARVEKVLSPPWSSDDITPRGRENLRRFGITPPERTSSPLARLGPRDGVPCASCNSTQTTLRSEFGSTPCKALYQCSGCGEPFEYFKCL